MQNLLNNRLILKEVTFVTPQSLNADTFHVCQFKEENVRELIDKNITCGIYLIGTIMPRMNSETYRINHEFRVCYFGRSDDDNYSLQDRICDHLAEGGREDEDHRYNNRLYFSAWTCDNSREAYEKEVELFDIFFRDTNLRNVANGYFNDIHYSRELRNLMPHDGLLPCNVYVDNRNRPAQPRR